MSHAPWRNTRYAEVGDNDDRQDTEVRRYPYFPTQQASDYHSDSNNNSLSTLNLSSSTLDLELCSSELTSSLGVGETTSGYFTADFPLVPPVQEKPRAPRPPLRRTNSINRRRPRSSEATVRRRFCKDLMLQKTAILQAIKGKDSDGRDDKKSLEKSKVLRLGHVHGGGTRDEEDDSKSIESRLGKLKLHDGNHRHHRTMTRLPRGREQWRRTRSERSLEVPPRSSSDEKRDLNRSIRSERRKKRRSEADLQELKSRSTVVEGTGGCSIIRPNHRFKPMDLTKPSHGKIAPPLSSEARVLRSQSHERAQAKLVRREQDDQRPSSFNKKEISDMYSQAHQRHLQRYSSKRLPTNGADD